MNSLLIEEFGPEVALEMDKHDIREEYVLRGYENLSANIKRVWAHMDVMAILGGVKDPSGRPVYTKGQVAIANELKLSRSVVALAQYELENNGLIKRLKRTNKGIDCIMLCPKMEDFDID